MLGGRYIIISHIETNGETAVLLKAKDCFHKFHPVVIKVVHLMYRFAGLQEVQTLRRLKTADPCHLSHTMALLVNINF
ncbi:unnamed protein product [Lymnaea stagnalis]|uniref:Uncharacterized protein n=1 Tax=Lymnaea stagnalis TaxID=6523 RepID=A0AAV2IHU4_LYMST